MAIWLKAFVAEGIFFLIKEAVSEILKCSKQNGLSDHMLELRVSPCTFRRLLERISIQYTQSALFRITFATSKFHVNLTCIGFNVF